MSNARRLIAIAGAYIAASLIAGAIIAAGMMWAPGGEVGPIDFDFLQITALFVGLVSFLVAMLALVPAALVSLYAERHGKRSPLFYGAAGGVIALAALGIYAALLVWNDTSHERFNSTRGAFTIIAAVAGFFAVAGVAGGLTYWALAGRTAGTPPTNLAAN